MVIIPVLVGLTLCGWAVVHSAKRVTIPLAVYAGTVMAVAVTITGDDGPILMRILIGAAIGIAAVLIGNAIRSERERTRETRESAQRMAEMRDRDVEHAVAQERLRIARDVHDITGHHLSAISLQAAGAGRSTPDPVARAAFERIHGLTAEALGQTRRALGVLRESGSAGRTPTPRLEHLEQLLETARAAGLTVDLQLDGIDGPLSDEIEVCVYRLVQESLTNVARHAGASAVRVLVACADEELLVTIDDDGAGGRGRAGGGIAGMRERVTIVGGSFTAGPAERGWSVRACIPLKVDPDPPDRAWASGASELIP
jgi:signal transduction histidine kinase